MAPGLADSPPHSEDLCKDPLFQTHWSGKNDIQTLAPNPVVKTDLTLCPAFNEKASCCHQTFESEQQKYFNFWRGVLEEKVLRLEAHRLSVLASWEAANREDVDHPLSSTDADQYQAVLDRYAEVMSPHVHGPCMDLLLTYIAGMQCFACRPDWFHYTQLRRNGTWGGHVIRLQLEPSVCLDLWATCEAFGSASLELLAALRDSKVARMAERPLEDLDMFHGRQELCDWAHDHIALHPFRLPTKEDTDVGLQAAGGDNAARMVDGRRLSAGEASKFFDVLQEGRVSTFDRVWRLPPDLSATGAASQLAARGVWSLAMLCGVALSLSL